MSISQASHMFLFSAVICSGSLKTYAFDDTSIGSWMIGVQATYIDDNRLCCSSIRQGKIFNIIYSNVTKCIMV